MIEVEDFDAVTAQGFTRTEVVSVREFIREHGAEYVSLTDLLRDWCGQQDLGAALRAAGLDYLRTPDGVLWLAYAGGGTIAVGEHAAGEWWDFTVTADDGSVIATDGAGDLDTVVTKLRRYID